MKYDVNNMPLETSMLWYFSNSVFSNVSMMSVSTCQMKIIALPNAES